MSTIRCGVCSTCINLLVPFDSAGGGLGRAPVVSRQRVLFSFFCHTMQASIRTYRYVSITVYPYKKHSGVGGKSLSVQCEGQWFESRMTLFFGCQFHVFLLAPWILLPVLPVQNCVQCTMMIEVVWATEKSAIYKCIRSAAAAAAAVLLCVAILLLLQQQ